MPQCKICLKDISKGRKFCSQECNLVYRQQNRHPLKKVCAWCHKEYEILPYEKAISKFCSKQCKHSYQRRHDKIASCSYCGKPVTINWYRKNARRYFCSRDCYMKSLSARVNVVCAGCGKPFTTYKSRQRYYHKLYCTLDCYKKHGAISTPGYARNEKYELLRHRLTNTAQFYAWRKSVLERDGYRCVACKSEQDLRVHHILELYKIVYKYNPTLSLDKVSEIVCSPEFNDLTNGKTLCSSCHLIEHHYSPIISKEIMQTP